MRESVEWIRRRLLQRVAQEAPQTQAVAGLQRDAALRIEAEQEPEQQQPEVHPRGQRRASEPVVVEAPAQVLDVVVEAGLGEPFVQLFEERQRGRFGQILRRQEQRRLLNLAGAHRHKPILSYFHRDLLADLSQADFYHRLLGSHSELGL